VVVIFAQGKRAPSSSAQNSIAIIHDGARNARRRDARVAPRIFRPLAFPSRNTLKNVAAWTRSKKKRKKKKRAIARKHGISLVLLTSQISTSAP
jgi:hypothetical protein